MRSSLVRTLIPAALLAAAAPSSAGPIVEARAELPSFSIKPAGETTLAAINGLTARTDLGLAPIQSDLYAGAIARHLPADFVEMVGHAGKVDDGDALYRRLANEFKSAQTAAAHDVTAAVDAHVQALARAVGEDPGQAKKAVAELERLQPLGAYDPAVAETLRAAIKNVSAGISAAAEHAAGSTAEHLSEPGADAAASRVEESADAPGRAPTTAGAETGRMPHLSPPVHDPAIEKLFQELRARNGRVIEQILSGRDVPPGSVPSIDEATLVALKKILLEDRRSPRQTVPLKDTFYVIQRGDREREILRQRIQREEDRANVDPSQPRSLNEILGRAGDPSTSATFRQAIARIQEIRKDGGKDPAAFDKIAAILQDALRDPAVDARAREVQRIIDSGALIVRPGRPGPEDLARARDDFFHPISEPFRFPDDDRWIVRWLNGHGADIPANAGAIPVAEGALKALRAQIERIALDAGAEPEAAESASGALRGVVDDFLRSRSPEFYPLARAYYDVARARVLLRRLVQELDVRAEADGAPASAALRSGPFSEIRVHPKSETGEPAVEYVLRGDVAETDPGVLKALKRDAETLRRRVFVKTRDGHTLTVEPPAAPASVAAR